MAGTATSSALAARTGVSHRSVVGTRSPRTAAAAASSATTSRAAAVPSWSPTFWPASSPSMYEIPTARVVAQVARARSCRLAPAAMIRRFGRRMRPAAHATWRTATMPKSIDSVGRSVCEPAADAWRMPALAEVAAAMPRSCVEDLGCDIGLKYASRMKHLCGWSGRGRSCPQPTLRRMTAAR
jgi:hypothetical protein